jgi:hypothetical protein
LTSSANLPIEERSQPRRGLVAAIVAGLAVLALVGAGPAAALPPVLDVRSNHIPTNFPPGGQGTYDFAVFNIGDETVDDDDSGCLSPEPPCPITARVTVPDGQTIATATGSVFGDFAWQCAIDPDRTAATCTYDPAGIFGPIEPGHQSCDKFIIGFQCPLVVTVDVAEDAAPGAATARVCGGNVPACASGEEPAAVSAAPADFGVQRLEWEVLDSDLSPSTRAGAHPWTMAMTVEMNTVISAIGGGIPTPSDSLKNLTFRLPQGVIGDPTATPVRCTRDQLGLQGDQSFSACPLSSQVGTISLKSDVSDRRRFPLFNMEPSPGVAAQFGLKISNIGVVVSSARVTPDGGYAVSVRTDGLPESDQIKELRIDLWGVPADPRHDVDRGDCLWCRS